MPIRTEEQIRNEILTSSQTRSEANFFGTGSVLYGLATDVSRLLREVEVRQEDILTSIHISTASFSQLESYARDMNVSVTQAKRAFTLATDKNIILSTTNGATISSVLTANGINLDGLPLFNRSGTVRYVARGVLGNLDSQQVYLGASCVSLGLGGNIGAGELVKFDKIYSNLTVTNVLPIYTGVDQETQEGLRARLLFKLESNLQNQQTIDRILIGIPGIGKSTILENYYGPGTMLICMQPREGVLFPSSYLREVESTLASHLKSGLKVKVKNFSLVPFTIEARIITNNASINGTTLTQNVANTIANFFNDLEGGSSIDLNSLEIAVVSSYPGIKLIGKQQHFEKVRYTVLDGTSSIEYVAEPGELILLDRTQLATLEATYITYE